MPNAILWDAPPTSEGTVLTTELNALADGAWSAAGSEYDNSADLRQFFQAVVAVDFVAAPTATAFLSLFFIKAVDGTNYDTIDTDNDPRADKLVATINLIDTTAAQIRSSNIFTLSGVKGKFILKNSSGQAFPATGSTVTLYSQADEIQ
jgi:hypothetical protein